MLVELFLAYPTKLRAHTRRQISPQHRLFIPRWRMNWIASRPVKQFLYDLWESKYAAEAIVRHLMVQLIW